MIHDSAVIDPSAVIGKNVKIGAFSVIGPNVEIGDDCDISSHVVIDGPTKIGIANKFYQFSSIGAECQDKKYQGENTKLEIGNNNTFREGCSVHRGTLQGGALTTIGSDNLFMVNTHVAHDCIIGNHVVFSNNASVAGHVRVDDFATLGGFVGVHQFCSVGAHSFSAGGTIVFKDVAPFVTVSGHPAKAFGLNSVGLERNNFSSKSIKILKQAYKIIFRTSTTIDEAVEKLTPLISDCKEVLQLLDFLKESKRGIIR